MSSPYHIFSLSNGIRVIHLDIPGATVAHCGLIINAGSRDERPEEHGLAHFIEHCLFKGTKKRKAIHILNRLDSVGGELNAFTSKENTCIHASFLTEHYYRAVELIYDIVFNSVFPEKEINKEKDVITDEINSYLDTPSEQIYDDFETLIFKNHPVGRGILGTTSHIKSFSPTSVMQFMARNYSTDEMVFTSVGNIPKVKVEKIVFNILDNKTLKKEKTKRKPFRNYAPFSKVVNRETFQAHCVLGSVAYSVHDKKSRTLALLSNILGGPAMNSRLTIALREKHGYCYNVDSGFTPYSDTGVFSIYLGTEKSSLDKCIAITRKELKKLMEKKLSPSILNSAKRQITGQIALGFDNKANLALSIGKNLLTRGKADTLEEISKKIEKISSQQLLEVANEIFDENKLSILTYSN